MRWRWASRSRGARPSRPGLRRLRRPVLAAYTSPSWLSRAPGPATRYDRQPPGRAAGIDGVELHGVLAGTQELVLGVLGRRIRRAVGWRRAAGEVGGRGSSGGERHAKTRQVSPCHCAAPAFLDDGGRTHPLASPLAHPCRRHAFSQAGTDWAPTWTDFASHRLKLVIELDGSHHGDEEELIKDAKRERWLEGQGYRVLRFWNHEVKKGTGFGARYDLCRRARPGAPTSPWMGEVAAKRREGGVRRSKNDTPPRR